MTKPPAPGGSARPTRSEVQGLRLASASEFLPAIRPWVRLAGAVLVGGFLAGGALMAAESLCVV